MNISLMLVLMVLTAYRATRLITKDDFPPLLWLRDRLAGGWRPMTLPEHEAYLAAPRVPDGPAMRKLSDTAPDWMRTIQPIDYEGSRGTQESRYVTRKSWSPYWLAELVTCPWCVSAYVSGALTAAVDITVGLPVPWLVGPAVWAATALLASREWA